MSLHLAVVLLYSAGMVALGLWTSRLVRSASDFFVAGRAMSSGLVFASMVAANIGAGATVGVAGLAYRDGLSAWWWSGSAGIGSLALAFWVGPRLWQLAKAHNFYTTGDYLEFRYGAAVRGVIATIIGLISPVILAAQLIAGAAILNAITGAPRWVGALMGGVVMTVYFAAGGLIGTAWVNTVQLGVMLFGFLLALPFAIGSAGGLSAFTDEAVPAAFTDFTYSGGPGSGWALFALTAPAFVISPGLIQKAYGAASARALKVGVALNAFMLLMFAFVPVLFGMSARIAQPGIDDPNAVLPTLLLHTLPTWLSAVALAAVFSTTVDTCDGILFMLSTSLAQDVYRRHVNPTADDRQLLRVTRLIVLAGGSLAIVLSIYVATVVGALTIFYSVLGVSMFVPVLGGLISQRAGPTEALAAIGIGVLTLACLALPIANINYSWLNPSLAGLAASAMAFVTVRVLRGLLGSGR
jgi:SSS family solute:Na+ symporter